jgi:hypothetical protein
MRYEESLKKGDYVVAEILYGSGPGDVPKYTQIIARITLSPTTAIVYDVATLGKSGEVLDNQLFRSEILRLATKREIVAARIAGL